MHDTHFADGAERQLAAIHSGGKHLLVVIRQRIAAALDRLDEGDFAAANEQLAFATGLTGTLANAQQYIAVADGSRLIKAADLEEGMEMTGVGVVGNVEVEACPSPQCVRHVKVMIGDHALRFHGDQEVYVLV